MDGELNNEKTKVPTIGSLFAGIGGFDLGFEAAGFKTAWQVEIDQVSRAVLAHRFPHATQFNDVKECGAHNLAPVDVLCGGFPCQDVSVMGKQVGLGGKRTGLFFEAIRIITEIQPQWVVLENVVGLLSSQDGRDFQTVLESLATCGYVGSWRVLDAEYFGVSQRRRRVFMVAGLRRPAPSQFLFDAQPMDALFGEAGTQQQPRLADEWAAHTLLACQEAGIIALGCENLVAHEGRWDQMVKRERSFETIGLRAGLDAANLAERKGAGNAVVPQVAKWIADMLFKEC